MSASNSVTRIEFLDLATLSPETTIRESAFPTELIEHDRTRPDEVAGRISEADIVITNKVPLGAEVLAAAHR